LTIGAVLASSVIIGRYEIAGVVVIIPYAIDFAIKAANRFPSTNWWGTWANGQLTHAGRPVGLGQAIMRLTGGLSERSLTLSLIGLEAVAATIAVLLFARR
jgi:UDP-N-acetylglucosamine--dolichyl-phosphate N-acetylglucosaminephosphotransferase